MAKESGLWARVHNALAALWRSPEPGQASVPPLQSWKLVPHAPAHGHGRTEWAYASANLDGVNHAVLGLDPFSNAHLPGAGARMVVNLSSAHVPAFCAAHARGDPRPYKNCYDLDREQGRRVSWRRRLVDDALPVPDPAQAYFGAVELQGAGIRFYGDMCFVLKSEAVCPATVILDRNSFEVLRSPIADAFNGLTDTAAAFERKLRLQTWSGAWSRDLGTMAQAKVATSMLVRDRRWTVGQISAAVRNDEDYIEVLKHRSFGPPDLQEVRVSAADAARDALVGERLVRGPTPRLEALLWSHRRRRAERALRDSGIPVHVVAGSGRTKD